MATTKLTKEELNLLGFDENGNSVLNNGGSGCYHERAWEAIPRPRTRTTHTCAPKSLHFPLVDDKYSQPTSTEQLAKLKNMVGKFVCVKGIYGMIDAVHNDRLGFVEGSADEWSSHIVPINQVRICTSMEAEIARSSAEWYFLNECESLHRRLAICGEREREDVAAKYKAAFNWYRQIKA